MSNRANFGSRLGAIHAAAEPAAELGNIWRFTCETGANGGAFILLYALCFIVVLLSPIPASAQQATTDRQWYLAGEAMNLNIDVPGSGIAYAELCDAHSLAAGTMVVLTGGTGVGCLELPPTMHSGYYQLSVYARGGKKVWQCLVPVINPLYTSVDDDITWQETTDATSSVPAVEPHVSMMTDGMKSALPVMNIPEKEGHIAIAHVRNSDGSKVYGADVIRPTLSIVGKQVHYFEGVMFNDTTAVFFTHGIQGRQPLVVGAITTTDVSLPIEIVSPFATFLPEALPHLTFAYNRAEVEERSRLMQLHQIDITPAKKELIIGEQETDAATIEVEPLPYDNRVFGCEPSLSYKLDDYRQFATIKETLLEYVRDVHRMSFNGISKLSVHSEQDGYASWPAMVFIDGMPVNDIDRLLGYDARRVHYINIYEDRYTFGNAMYKGILSFVTRSGRLTNYPTEPNVSYLVYDFPK